MKLLAWGRTDDGRKRDHNEDNYLVNHELGLFAVADGMGGHQGGETASRIACQVLEREIAAAIDDFEAAAARYQRERHESTVRVTQPIRIAGDEPLGGGEEEHPDDVETNPLVESQIPAASMVMREAAREASLTIFDMALEDAGLRGMGTTLTAMLYDAGRMHLVHAGDSRAYLFRDSRLEQLTEDHSWIAEQVRSGAMTEAEAKESKFRHIITRSVGFEREVEVDHVGIAVEAGDCFLLCSDGMSNYIDNAELERILRTTWYRRAPQLLIDLANERGGDDNITVVVVCVANHLG